MAEPPTVKPKELFILGLTSSGRAFRPSDWAERLCGVLSCYRPPGRQQSQQHLQQLVAPPLRQAARCGGWPAAEA